jgi:hypothetical protein
MGRKQKAEKAKEAAKVESPPASSSAKPASSKLTATSMRQFGRVVTVDVAEVIRGSPEKGEKLTLALVDGHTLEDCPPKPKLGIGETHYSLPYWSEEPIAPAGKTASFDDVTGEFDDDDDDDEQDEDVDDDADDTGDAARGDATHPPEK